MGTSDAGYQKLFQSALNMDMNNESAEGKTSREETAKALKVIPGQQVDNRIEPGESQIGFSDIPNTVRINLGR